MKNFTAPKQLIFGFVGLSAALFSFSVCATAQDAEAAKATDDNWCATPQYNGSLVAQTTRSFRGVVTAIDSETNVIKVDAEYQVILDDKTIETKNKVVEIVLTSGTILRKVSETQVAAPDGKTTTKIQMQPLPRAAIKVGQSVAFSVVSPLSNAAKKRDNDAIEPPARAQAAAVFVRDLVPPKAE